MFVEDFNILYKKLLFEIDENHSQNNFQIDLTLFKKNNSKIKKILISSRLTNKCLIRAIESNCDLILSIYPPFLINHSTSSIYSSFGMKFLYKLMTNSIAVYTLGHDWLTAPNNGLSYLLQILDFPNKTPFFIKRKTKQKLIPGMFGERAEKILFKDFLVLLSHNFPKSKIYYRGSHYSKIKKILILPSIPQNELICDIAKKKLFDALVIGEITYDQLVELSQFNIILTQIDLRELENFLLAKIRRSLMEHIEYELPELLVFKQPELLNQFGTAKLL